MASSPVKHLRRISAVRLTKITSCFLLDQEPFLELSGDILDFSYKLKTKYYLKINCVINIYTQSRIF